MTDTFDLASCLWGKARPPDGVPGPEWHPLICHMIDVMHVADVLLGRIPPITLDLLYGGLGGTSAARPWLRLLIALHDIGKATPGFQRKWPGITAAQAAIGLPIKVEKECHPHGISGTAILTELLSSASFLGDCSLDRRTARSLARAVAAHHGEFASNHTVECCWDEDLPPQLRTGTWRAAIDAVAQTIKEVALASSSLEPIAATPNNGFVIALAGLTSVADWLGSNAEVFKYEPTPINLKEYVLSSRQRAETAVDDAGWYRLPAGTPRSFEQLFPFPPRSLQAATANVVDSLEQPGLFIIESTMGDGKTEAALLISEQLAPRVGQAGIYVGLPTQATANQMLGRVEGFLKRTYPGQANLQLVHGDAALSDRFRSLKLQAIYGHGGGPSRSSDNDAPRVAAEVWFAQGKRALLATHAVGTVDQGLLGAMQTKHGFVRLFGLAGKTVILDEVHAYDTYTSELLDRLVAWLAHLKATVVILSATLPQARRRKLMEAYGATPPASEAPYPRITAATLGGRAFSVGTEPSRRAQQILVTKREDDIEAIARDLVSEVAQNRCIAWICNTVSRAQQAYSTLKRLQEQGSLPNDVELSLMHSRFMRKDRQAQEEKAEASFGPSSNARPRRAILIGTQVLEQSLDLDFDLMVSDLAPIDLVLQRTGRLHRHERAERDSKFKPELWLIMPELVDGIPSFKKVARVYDEDVMFRTWWELRNTRSFEIPSDLEVWIERVYGAAGTRPSEAALIQRLEEVESRVREERAAELNQALGRLLFAPSKSNKDPFGSTSADLQEDESNETHKSLRALTRLAEPTIDVLCVWRTGAGVFLDPGERLPLSLDGDLSHETLRTLLGHGLKIEEWRAGRLADLIEQPAAWRTQGALRFKHALFLGAAATEAGVRLDSELGLLFDAQ